MDGVLPLWKPRGMTSHDCVKKIRGIFQTKKVGHTGTLDPNAEGVLPICIGEATKIVPFLINQSKTYVAECTLGTATETEDVDGQVIATKEVHKPITKAEIDDVLACFTGEITQIPPMYSAVRVKGKRLYEYARNNETVERPKRQVTIYEINNLLRDETTMDKFSFEVHCSAGTYIRTLCVDIGNQLGYPAHMSHLVRTRVGAFAQEDTVTFAMIEEAKQANQLDQMLVSMAEALKDLDYIQVDEQVKNKVLHGQKLKKTHFQIKTDRFLVLYQDQLLAIYEIDPHYTHMLKPIRVFNSSKKSR